MNGGIIIPEGVGRAASKLADTVRHVVDIAVGPDRIRARAQAQADSAVILAEGHARAMEIEARTIERLKKRETRRQHNIENITVKAVAALPPPEQISEEKVSEDWTSRFFEECQDIGDEEMQQIWARIMAGEVARPGSFAPKTLSVVRDLTKGDANLFTTLCSFVWGIPGVGLVPVILDVENAEVVKNGLHFAELTHLTSLGLIEFSGISGYGLTQPMRQISVQYCGRVHSLSSTDDRKFGFGRAVFTAVGRELAMIANAPGSEAIRQATLAEWEKAGWQAAENEPASG